MTTPRDDIAGLIERLKHLVSLNSGAAGGPYQGYAAKDCVKAMEKAATQLDSLLKERDAMQARVENLVADRDTLAAWAKKEEDRADALQARVKELEAFASSESEAANKLLGNGLSLVDRLENAESRALRAEQERDEAYERAIRELQQSYPDHAWMNAACACIRGLAVGPEKEKTSASD